MTSTTPFLTLLQRSLEHDGLPTDDLLAALLPLLRQVQGIHEQGLVAPLRGLEHVLVGEAGQLGVDATRLRPPQRSGSRLAELERPASRAVEVVGEARRVADIDRGALEVQVLEVADDARSVTRPAYLPGYVTWEHAIEHHDALTDIHSLGLLFASLACGLDLSDPDDVKRLAAHAGNLFALNPRLHPIVAAVIGQMLELRRARRAQDLGALIRRLETYRDQPQDLDLSRIPGLEEAPPADRRKLIQAHLRDRLFDLSRRNRLLHFKSTAAMLNLTVASVPIVLDYRNIRLEQLFVWHGELAALLSRGETLQLGRWLRFEDAPYLPGALDKILAQARRDRAEYGFSQLRLVLCFLRWHNLKEEPQERIHSPLLLLPVELARKKGVRDSYTLEPISTEAEVNPALRHHLKQLYGLELPEAIDLRETSLDAFCDQLGRQVQASEPAVTVHRVDKPQIQIIHERARQRVHQFRRRAELLARRASKASLDYSYERDDFRPLGLQLFLRNVRPEPLPLRDAVAADPAPRTPQLGPEPAPAQATGGTHEQERQCYALRDEEAATGNPYSWEIDLCALTLGNFNYRKMTLVRDYSRLLEEDLRSDPFDAVFSLAPRPVDEEAPPPLPLAEQHFVVSSDGAQAAAVARSRQGSSLIIQGPPGTGKSQTITNLIADFVARGKRVLFVCEKRAAIDVVFHRLRQQGLEGLCTLIHDSQADKREFIHELRGVYEGYLAAPAKDGAEEARTESLRLLDGDVEALRRFSGAMLSTPPQAGASTRRLLERLIELRGVPGAAPTDGEGARPLTPEEQELLPTHAQWLAHGDVARRLETALADLEGERVLARHPLRHLGKAIAQAPRPLEALHSHLDAAESLLRALETALAGSGLPAELWDTFDEIHALLAFAASARDLASRDQLALLDPRSAPSASLAAWLAEVAERMRALATAAAKTVHWREKLPAADVEAALREARALEGSFLRLFKPAFWRLRSALHARYDFARHVVRPAWSAVLADLQAEQAAAAALASSSERLRREYGAEDPAALDAALGALRGTAAPQHPSVARLRAELATAPAGAALVLCLAELHGQLASLDRTLGTLLAEHRALTFPELKAAIADLQAGAPALPDLAHLLAELGDAPAEIGRALRRLPLGVAQLEAAVGRRCLEQLYRTDRQLEKLDGRALERRVERLGERWTELLGQNAACLRARVRRAFLDHVSLSSAPAAQLSPEQKAFKKSYAAGRRELEHELGKSMRYKSIRDLAAGESGQVLRDLKPIWLMSPLSVSDTLPLEPSLFDVVIFDEASQIPLEEAVPALYRAAQVIVVGDEMQLPPTAFFTAAREHGEEAVEVEVEEDGERFQVLLDADSFLNQAGRNLPSALLAWHYRSRHEALISFSNAAYYAGRLNTVPDRALLLANAGEIRVAQAADAARHAGELLRRSISFHFLDAGRYDRRRNAPEAAYIAELVRELLRRETGLSLGVVAFSEAQQTEIEEALDRLARDDREFERRLEEEYIREEHDQFCGLFVKNLENVQGDERDVIILSVCYGPGPDRRVLMNFGPINQQGGEKRLNVIFSRARQHMAVVTSMRHGEITNDYNDGARSLKGFLEYAEAVSRGDLEAARRVLEELSPLARKALAPLDEREVVAASLAAALRAKGHAVDERVGQSRFRCDLAVRGDGAYRLGILVDTSAHYANPDLLERYVLQPGVLRSFGWEVELVLAKDWFHEPAAVLSRLEKRLQGAKAAQARS